MTISTASLEQIPVDGSMGGSRPVASLDARPEDLYGITWTAAEDDLGPTLFAVVKTPSGSQFGLEATSVHPKQVTVYGSITGEALTELVAGLGLTQGHILDRVDADAEDTLSDAEDAMSDLEAALAQMERRVDDRLERLMRQLGQLASDQTRRKAAAAAVELGELTARQRQILALVRDGLSVGEISELLGVSKSTVRGHTQAGLKALRKAGESEIWSDTAAHSHSPRFVGSRRRRSA